MFESGIKEICLLITHTCKFNLIGDTYIPLNKKIQYSKKVSTMYVQNSNFQ